MSTEIWQLNSASSGQRPISFTLALQEETLLGEHSPRSPQGTTPHRKQRPCPLPPGLQAEPVAQQRGAET